MASIGRVVTHLQHRSRAFSRITRLFTHHAPHASRRAAIALALYQQQLQATRLGQTIDAGADALTLQNLRFTRHTSHFTRHTSHVTRHTTHVTRHTSHVTRHTSHVTLHTSSACHRRGAGALAAVQHPHRRTKVLRPSPVARSAPPPTSRCRMYLLKFYTNLGFEVRHLRIDSSRAARHALFFDVSRGFLQSEGDDYLEDHIPHVHMRRGV